MPTPLELYDKLVKTIPEVQRKGDTNPYTSHNGHIVLAPDANWSIRDPASRRGKRRVSQEV